MIRRAALLVVIASLLSSCSLLTRVKTREDGFFVHGAALADPAYLARLDARAGTRSSTDDSAMGLFAHRLTAGTGTIVAYRFYSPGSVIAMDDEVFDKLTIWFRSTVPAAGAIAIDDSVVVVYTRGGSAWPRSACSGTLESGEITITPKGGRLDVVVAGPITQAGNHNPEWCRLGNIRVAFTASERSFKSLTPWLGRAGDHPYDESYRR